MARPTDYSKEIADRICELIATSSFGLHTICQQNNELPSYSTIFRWLGDPDKKEFKDNYTRAREEQADFMADEILNIADDATNDFMKIVKGDAEYEVENKEWTSRSKLRVEARKWIASKLKPKKYGDKLDVTADLSIKAIPPLKYEMPPDEE